MTTTAEHVEQTAAELGLTMTAEFVPWSRSRNAGEKHPSLNWRVTLHKGWRAFLTTDYMAGSGHCPSYKQGRLTVDEDATIKQECQTGRKCRNVHGLPGEAINPKLADVLCSLVRDGDAIEFDSFEDWADSLGEDTDSRKAEAVYRACLDTGLKLRNALGEDGLKRLREALQDY